MQRLLPRLAAATAAALTTGLLTGQEAPRLTLRQAVSMPWTLSQSLPERRWIPGATEFAAMDPRQRTRVWVHEVGSEKTRTLFTGRQLNEALIAAGAKLTGPVERILTPWSLVDAKTVRVELPGAIYRWTLGAPAATRTFAWAAGHAPQALGSDDERVAYVKDHQLVVHAGNTTTTVSKDGSADIVYGGPAHRSEFGIHDGLWWSPDGRFLAFFREDLRPVQAYPYVDHTAVPPKALHGRYPMAGQANSYVQIGVFDTQSKHTVYLQWGDEKDVYWTNATFAPDGETLTVAIVHRNQDRMDLVSFESASGKSNGTLFSETDDQWIEPEHGPIHVPDGSGRFLWFSPRSGFRQLYLYEKSGKLVRRVTAGGFDVREFVTFTADGKRAFVMGSGPNPLELHLWSVDIAGGPMRRLTQGRGQHTCEVRHDGRAVLDSYSNLDLPGRSEVLLLTETGARRPDGGVQNAVTIGHNFPVRGQQKFFQVPAEDGTTLHGTVILPPGLDAKRRYPALLYVYGGPHSQLVKDQWLGGSSPWLHYLATRGIVVCTLDNRGTDNRGIEFSQSIHRRMAELETKDQLEAVEYLGSLGFVDPGRIGVHGWSYGGLHDAQSHASSAEGYSRAGSPAHR